MERIEAGLRVEHDADQAQEAVSLATRLLFAGKGKLRKSGRERLEVELQRLHHARVHIVAADEDGQFHDLPRIEMALHLGKDVIGYRDVAGNRIGIGEGGALALGEQF